MTNLKGQVEKIMQDNPVGCLMGYTKTSVNALFWDNAGQTEKVLLQNLISGAAHHAISSGRLTKREIMENLEKVLFDKDHN